MVSTVKVVKHSNFLDHKLHKVVCIICSPLFEENVCKRVYLQLCVGHDFGIRVQSNSCQWSNNLGRIIC